MYAVVISGGKQYRVSVGDVIEVEKISAELGAKVELEVLMTVDGDKVVVGSDITAKATAEIVSHGRGKKLVIFKYKAKKNERKKMGHRQSYSRIKIATIG